MNFMIRSFLILVAGFTVFCDGANLSKIGDEQLYPGANGPESPRIYFGLTGLYETTRKFESTQDISIALETPLPAGNGWVNRLHFRTDRVEGVKEKIMGIQTAIRRYPWDWLPGLFSELQLGYENIQGKYFFVDNVSELPWEPARSHINTTSWSNHSVEPGIGLGYQWKRGPFCASLGLLFGPYLFIPNRTKVGPYALHIDFYKYEGRSLLRLNHFEIGFVF
jgi:hypothetical protein